MNNYKEKYLKYKEKYLELKNQSGSGLWQEKKPEMSEEEFSRLCGDAREGKTAEVLAAVDQDRRLATRAEKKYYTLLMCSCQNYRDNPQIVQGLLERGANVNDRARDTIGLNALMFASNRGHILICTVLLDYGADPNSISTNQWNSALSLAAMCDYIQMCLLLISRGANLMMPLAWGTALSGYGQVARHLTPDELEKRRAILRTAFEQGPFIRWARRWPMMSVIAGCGFRPLAANSRASPPTPKGFRQRLNQLITYSKAPPPPPIQIVLTSLPRAYYMKIIFRSDRLVRLIVSFL